MERQPFRISARPFAVLVSAATLFAALSILPSPTIASAATSAYLGAAVDGMGTVLGTAAYVPPSGAIYVDAVHGSDSNAGAIGSPVKTVARGLVIAPAGATLVLRTGNYHESVTVTKQVTIQNYPREVVWFDGSTPVSAWAKSGTVWTAPWTTFFPRSDFGGVRSDFPYANYPAQVFIDGTALQEVGSLAEVTTGKFYADSANKRLAIGTDPTGRTVASSDLQRAIQIGTTNVNLKGFGVRRYATTSAARAAVLMDPDGGTFENLVVSDNAAEGLALSGANKTIRNLTVERNGMMGLGMDRANNASITKSVVRYNNSEHFPTQPVASGIKITRAAKARISNNLITDSYGASGLWLDEYCSDVVITDNTITNNEEMQLNMEASTRLIIANNTVTGGRKGIELRDTDNSRVFNNHITSYTLMGIFLAQDERWANTSLAKPGFTLLVKKNTIANNVIGCGARFQIFGKDAATNISMDKFDMTISGNVFSVHRKTPELNMVAWGLSDNVNVEFIQSPLALQTKNATWKNLQSTTCTTDPSTTIATTTLNATSTPIPADIAQYLGVPTGTRTIGLIGTTTPTPTPTPTPTGQNRAPKGQVSASASDLTVTTNGAGSTDPDGVVVSYAWNFGDGGKATGATSKHSYQKAGTYSVALTVKDYDGATATASTVVTVAAPRKKPGSVLADDLFSRKLKGAWGSAKAGGAWNLNGGSSSFSVSGGKGVIALTPSASREATLPLARATSTLSKTKVAFTVPKSGSVSLTLIGRKVGDSYYGARITISASGLARVYALRGDTQLGATSYRIKEKYKSGKALQLKTQVSGTKPTTVRVKVWAAGKSEPSKWSLMATDSTAALQAAGYVGVKTYEGATAKGPTQVRLYDYRSVVGPA